MAEQELLELLAELDAHLQVLGSKLDLLEDVALPLAA